MTSIDVAKEAFDIAHDLQPLDAPLVAYRERLVAFVARMTDTAVPQDGEQAKRETIHDYREKIEQLDVAITALRGNMLDGKAIQALLDDSFERNMSIVSIDGIRYTTDGVACVSIDAMSGMLKSVAANVAQAFAGRMVKP